MGVRSDTKNGVTVILLIIKIYFQLIVVRGTNKIGTQVCVSVCMENISIPISFMTLTITHRENENITNLYTLDMEINKIIHHYD